MILVFTLTSLELWSNTHSRLTPYREQLSLLLHYLPPKDHDDFLEKVEKQLTNPIREFWCDHLGVMEYLFQKNVIKKRSSCPEFQQWFQYYQPNQISLVFASQFFDDPASILGHSFLLIGSATLPQFLQMTLNYAARTPSKISTIQYVWNGLTGGFQSQFNLFPFYERVNTYNLEENRDLWIYPIKMNAGQRRLFLSHIWEILKKDHLPYYFFSQNCASKLTNIFEAVFEGKKLKLGLRTFTTPLELTQIAYRQGQLSKPTHIPSLKRQYQSTKESIERDLLKLRIKKLKGAWNELDELNWNTLLSRLSNRPPLKKTGGKVDSKLSPHKIIPPARFRYSHGFADEKNKVFLGNRMGFHDLVDPIWGYRNPNILTMGEIDLSYERQKKQLRLESLTFLEFDKFLGIRRWSWGASLRTEAKTPLSRQLFTQSSFSIGKSILLGPLTMDLRWSPFFSIGNTPFANSLEWATGHFRVIYNHEIFNIAFKYIHFGNSKFQDFEGNAKYTFSNLPLGLGLTIKRLERPEIIQSGKISVDFMY